MGALMGFLRQWKGLGDTASAKQERSLGLGSCDVWWLGSGGRSTGGPGVYSLPAYQPINLSTEFEVSVSTHYQDMKDSTKWVRANCYRLFTLLTYLLYDIALGNGVSSRIAVRKLTTEHHYVDDCIAYSRISRDCNVWLLWYTSVIVSRTRCRLSN